VADPEVLVPRGVAVHDAGVAGSGEDLDHRVSDRFNTGQRSAPRDNLPRGLGPGARTPGRDTTAAAELSPGAPVTRWYIAVLPFGIGQLANGQRTKGWVLLGVEVALLATSAASLGTALGLRNERGNYPVEDADTARTLNVVYLAAAYTALAVMVYGAVDGLVGARRARPVEDPASD